VISHRSAPGVGVDHRYGRPAVADGPTLRVVSFNLRNARAVDGWNSWPFRRRTTATALRDLDPDVAGLQEAYACQERYLLRAVPGYSSVSTGRAAGDKGERCPLLRRTAGLRQVAGRTRWYGDDPDRPGTTLPGATFPRIATLVELEDRASGRRFGAVNTHFDERLEANRARSAGQLLGWLRDDLPWLLIGDLNARPDEAAIRTILDGGFRMAVPDGLGGTTHQWKGGTAGRRIDYIFVSDGWEVLDGAVDHSRPGGRLPSDHWPIYADVRLRN
jgi:endonuclease/exonuclease/phosphatase family metal-dependent hydrolase